LSREVIGQRPAVAACADAVTIAKARLNDPARPIASFLFLGPTGVGKTQCAKSLAKYLFGVIMTSDLGTTGSDPPGFGVGDETPSSSFNRAAQTFFRPEFYNRIDAVLSFHALDRVSVRRIVEKELSGLNAREGLTKRDIKLTWTERLVDHLAQEGFNARFGARPLQRTIEAQVVTPLALYLNRHTKLSNAKLRIDLDQNLQVVVKTE
jgi:ATP-dependent Clp protease ATP-binding subunit ClpC